MAEPLLPANLSRAVTRAFAEGQVRARTALTAMANACQREVQAGLAETSHTHDTPTPAHKGGPPAAVKGNLRRSITHDPITGGLTGFSTRLGPSSAGYYGKYQEQDLGFPFLEKRARDTVETQGPAIWLSAFGGAW